MSGQMLKDAVTPERISKRYFRRSVCLTAGLFLAGLLLANVLLLDDMQIPLIVSAIFSVVMDTACGVVWRRIAEKSRDSLTTFYTAVSGFRMLLALATMFVYYVVAGGDKMLVFFLTFMAFYVALLIHNTLFFAGVSKNS